MSNGADRSLRTNMISNFMLSVGHLNGSNRMEKQTELTLYSSA